MHCMVRFLCESLWPPFRWERIIREENAAERIWYIENVIPFWRDQWPRIVMRRYEKPSVLSGLLKSNTEVDRDE